MKRKSVIFLSNIPSPYRVAFFNELGKYCDLTVCFEGEKATDRDEKWKSDTSDNYKEVFLKGIRTSADGFFCWDIIKHLKCKWDVIIVGGYATPTQMFAIEYLRIHKIAFILEVDGGIIKKDSKFKHYLKKHLVSSASWWFSTGDKTDEYLIHYGAEPDRCYHYPFTSLSIQDIKKAEALRKEKETIKKKNGMSSKLIVISVGRFIHGKGFDVLLNAMPMIKHDVVCYIIGGNPTDEYKDIINKLRLTNINIIPFLSKEELGLYYAASDLFVLPTRQDVWGLVINEAMAYGLPVITTKNCVAGLELVKDNGYVIESDNPEILADAIDKAFENNDVLIEMGNKSLEMICNYSIEKMAARHADLFDEIFR